MSHALQEQMASVSLVISFCDEAVIRFKLCKRERGGSHDAEVGNDHFRGAI